LSLHKLPDHKKLSKTITYRPDKIPTLGTLVANSPILLENIFQQILLDKNIQIVPKRTEKIYAT